MELIRTNWMIGSVGAGIWTASRGRAEPGAYRVVVTAVAQIISTAAVPTRRYGSRARAVASHLLVGVLTTLLGVLDD